MRRNWQRDELLLVLHLYCQTPFGRLHRHNPDIIRLAELIGRTPSAVAMKAVNFANLDPNLERQGLSSVSRADRNLWQEFMTNSNEIALAAEDLYEQRVQPEKRDPDKKDIQYPVGETESVAEIRVRRVQGFFRKTLLVSYERKCALSGLAIPDLLVASHIIPWRESESRRADPTNGILLNALYDKAFDKGYMTFDEDYRVCLASDIHSQIEDSELISRLLGIEGDTLNMPERFRPDDAALDHHRNFIFKDAV